MTKKLLPIKYTSRDFESIRNDLLEHAKRYYPDSYKDFNQGGFGSLMLDTVSYVGDILSFYLDYQANECFLDTANEVGNILSIAKSFGFKGIAGKSSSTVATFYIAVPALNGIPGPDKRYYPILKKGAILSTKNKFNFILMNDVNFKNADQVRVLRTAEDGTPTYYGIKAYGKVISGNIVSETIEVGEYTKFRKIQLGQSGIVEIISVLDSEGNEYTEVEHMSQNVVYKSITNRDPNTNSLSREILKPFIVPRRFVVETDGDRTYLQFGASSDVSKDTHNMLTDPVSSILDINGKEYISSQTFDPTVILSSDKLGISPSNTTLTVTYRYNPPNAILNFTSNALNEILSFELVFEDEQYLDASMMSYLKTTLEVTNETPIKGDTSTVSPEELKIRIKDHFSAQNRAVTTEDYKALCYSMPSKFGSIKRVGLYRDDNSYKRNLNLYILCENSEGNLVIGNQIVKENLKTWLMSNKMINDSIDILDGKVVNYGIKFSAIGDINVSKYDTLNDAISQLKKDFALKKDFGESIVITDIYSSLKKVPGIVDVVNVEIVPKSVAGIYSSHTFSFEKSMSSDKRYIQVPQNVIMEIKYPNSDIQGTIF